jgi:hypothetical protein
MGCCLFATALAGMPRLAGALWWIFQTARWDAVFNGSFFIPLVGLLFLPWTTIMYVLVYRPTMGIFDWILVGFALVIDIASYTGGGVANQRRTASA